MECQPTHVESSPSCFSSPRPAVRHSCSESASAEGLSYAISGEIDPADIGWPVLPVVALGSLSDWITLTWCRADTETTHASSSSEAVNAEKTLSSASQTSILILVLLYLGISQTSAYVKRMVELVEAREAFASDVLYAFFSKGGALTSTSSSSDGKPLESSSPIHWSAMGRRRDYSVS
jgi:hypothetical protein